MAIPHLRRGLFITGTFGVVAFALLYYQNKPRVLAVGEVSIAYWAWRTTAPDPVDVEKAFSATNAKTLFIRAGQFGLVEGKVRRIRPLQGTLPRRVELHLVYNATPGLLRDLDSIDTTSLARTIAETYKADLARSRNDSAQVFGIQLDLDFPNRLLPKYATLLQELRRALSPDTKLSITGLSAWMATSDLATVLEYVDFWIPQCYGGSIPTRIAQRTPISSAAEVARTVSQARRLGKPFYAGLSAYTYAILYDTDGKLLEIRGNIGPSKVEQHDELEQVERRPFSGNGPGEIRYEYRAKNDLVLDGLVVGAGQSVVLDIPSSDSLRATARAVRENAGELLLGICVFRIPTSTDGAVLSIREVAAALTDAETVVETKVVIERATEKKLRVIAENTGTSSSLLGDNAFAIDIDLTAGMEARIEPIAGFSSYETLCRVGNITPPIPCSSSRADILRLRASAWNPSKKGIADLSFEKHVPTNLSLTVVTNVDDGRHHVEILDISAPLQ